MIQCDNCANWKEYTDRRTGKKHYSCKLTGYRSTNKWRKHQCTGFAIPEEQMYLSEVGG